MIRSIPSSRSMNIARNLNASTRRCIRTLHQQRTIQKSRVPGSVTKRNLQAAEKSTSIIDPSFVSKVTNGVKHPSPKQLKAVFISSAVPMIAFGFMDNLIMIQAGGYIDATFGAAFGLATLTAAALGQVVSDVSGVAFGGVVERTFDRFHLTKTPSLTDAQRKLSIVRNIRMAAGIFGVALGCVLGAGSLLFMDLEARERRERTAELKDIICKMISASRDNDELQCEECRIHLASSIGETFDSSSLRKIENDGLSLPVVVQDLISFNNNSEEVDSVDRWLPTEVVCARDVICISKNGNFFVPILMGKEKKTVGGVLEFRGTNSDFSMDDQNTAQILARHIGIFMERLSHQS